MKKVKQSNAMPIYDKRQYTKLKLKNGAGDEIRTRDNLLGRQGLYQLSYSRLLLNNPLHPWSG